MRYYPSRPFQSRHSRPDDDEGVEWLEIRPIRPNQNVLLPGMVVRGNGVKFEIKERGHYRTRNGFSQTDGFSQYSGSFHSRCSRLHFPSSTFRETHSSPADFGGGGVGGVVNPTLMSHLFAPPLTKLSMHGPYPSGPASILQFRPTSTSENHRLFRNPTSLDVQRKLEESRLISEIGKNGRRKRSPVKKVRRFAFGRTFYEDEQNSYLPKIKFQNYVSNDYRSSRTSRSPSASPKRSSNIISNGSTTSKSLSRSTSDLKAEYDALIEKHIKKQLSSVNGVNDEDEEDDDDVSSLTESDQLSVIGADLVKKSLDEITDGMKATSINEQEKKKSVTFEEEERGKEDFLRHKQQNGDES